jgi:glycerol-3-phosphate dehydrogenase
MRHLADLLLRRVRIGLLTPSGGAPYLDRIERLCRPVLPWDDARWRTERAAYLDLWNQCYGVPEE